MSFFLCVFCVSECVYRDKKRRYSTRLIKKGVDTKTTRQRIEKQRKKNA